MGTRLPVPPKRSVSRSGVVQRVGVRSSPEKNRECRTVPIAFASWPTSTPSSPSYDDPDVPKGEDADKYTARPSVAAHTESLALGRAAPEGRTVGGVPNGGRRAAIKGFSHSAIATTAAHACAQAVYLCSAAPCANARICRDGALFRLPIPASAT